MLRREDGVALVIAVLILAIVSIATATAIFYTTGNQGSAYRTKAGTTAYALAQGGVSNALGQLTTHYYDNTGQPKDSTTSLTNQAQNWAPSGSQVSTSNAASCTSSTTCMTWSAVLNCPTGTSCPGGSTVTVTGVERAIWHISATGRVPNPAGTTAISRTITVDVPVNQVPVKTPAPDILKAVYSGKPDDGQCDMSMGQGVVFTSPLYVVGNLCIDQHSGVETPGTLNVGGWLDTGQKGHVGTSSSPLSSMAVAHACNGSHSSTPACTLVYDGVNHYYSLTSQNLYSSAQVSNSPTFPAVPVVDWTTRQQDSVGWSCTGGQQLSAANFDLASSTYSCTAPSGSLSFNGTTVTINGNIYIPNNLVTTNNEDVVYTGIGGIYVGGTASFGNNSSICVGSTDHHSCPSGPNWDTANNFLMIMAKGAVSGSNFNFEGGLYSDVSIDFGSGHTGIDGPMVTPNTLVPGQQASSGFPNIQTVITGAPDTTTPWWTLGSPINGTY
jgi:hypothetical protein